MGTLKLRRTPLRTAFTKAVNNLQEITENDPVEHYTVLCSRLPLRTGLETKSASTENSTSASSSSTNVLANRASSSEVLLQTLVVMLQNGNHESLGKRPHLVLTSKEYRKFQDKGLVQNVDNYSEKGNLHHVTKHHIQYVVGWKGDLFKLLLFEEDKK
ncbi:hypothetical protein TNIN_380971 [Trichonephila inaurata madagascariensis]|uniref:Uncharacterized protein n=1 Tax=Trichonephila inaurata madagascariensis TaxID=2747483 RepID=A0A8X6XMS5_9ARAC|nr:hypothetical protein TNIN_380971 [Trichonephila inaurata madagascariensis]